MPISWSPSSVPPSGAASALAPPSWTSAIWPASITAASAACRRALERLRLAGAGHLLEAAVGPSRMRRAAADGADAVDRRLHHDLQQPDAVEAGRERLADAPDRLLQPRALALELLQPRLELARHRVELLAQRGELVVALGGNGDREVAAAEPPRGLQQALDLGLQPPGDRDREDEGERPGSRGTTVGRQTNALGRRGRRCRRGRASAALTSTGAADRGGLERRRRGSRSPRDLAPARVGQLGRERPGCVVASRAAVAGSRSRPRRR